MHPGNDGGLTEPDMEAAQQLLQLSSGEEDDDSEGVERYQKNKKRGRTGEAEASVEEEHSEEVRSRKRQRFRSLVAIYKVTKPIGMGCNGDEEKKGMRRQEV
ncbi:hypothetical protein BHE74_00035842 [Ensete ventricosum]|uniref:Uncharacterized protein n=1 Tax=Ensete ventricosum TaxID=4639 RepID=A0A444DTX4_ENSVE|nr:hypothetical protein B296_00043983 [Ensete ventricosum]RWW01573.1 hypothetical protein GW17_00035381 [Ensete ventricosum]RWW57382.1 hypothetical protein BHE74_00035842 [Ensete ventricosum]RZS05000.1 hypothetical protein BHM03_00035432 [Ensete ventricosum]